MKAIVIFLMVAQSICLVGDFKILLTNKTWPMARKSKQPGKVFAEAVVEMALITWCAMALTSGS